jgi:hypothetical protein
MHTQISYARLCFLASLAACGATGSAQGDPTLTKNPHGQLAVAVQEESVDRRGSSDGVDRTDRVDRTDHDDRRRFNFHAAADPSAPPEAADTEADEDSDEEPDEVELPEPTITKLQRSYEHLRSTGALPEECWRLWAQPPQARYARVRIVDDANDGIVDGYAKFALVPLDADGAEPYRFYLQRQGGVAGWQFLAGPFDLEPMIYLAGEQHAGQTITLKKNDHLLVDVYAQAAADWLPAGGQLGTPGKQILVDAKGRLRTRFSFATPLQQSLRAGEQHGVQFVYQRRSDRVVLRQFTLQVRVR